MPRDSGLIHHKVKPRRFSNEAGTPGKEFAEHGYEATREAAMAAFAKSWRRE